MNKEKFDLELIAEFLSEHIYDFQEFLENKEIEGFEADMIIEELEEEINRM